MRGGDDAKPAAEENNVASDGTLNDSQEDSETAGSESNTKRLNEKADEPEAAATSSGSDKESASKSSNAAAKDSSIDNKCNSGPAATTLAPEQDHTTEALAKPSNVEVDDTKTATEATTETKDSNQPLTTAEEASKPSSATAKPASVADPDKHKPHKNHCEATDDGPLKSFWRSMRLAIKSGNDPSTVASASTARTNANREHELQLFANRYALDLERASNRRRTRPRRAVWVLAIIGRGFGRKICWRLCIRIPMDGIDSLSELMVHGKCREWQLYQPEHERSLHAIH